jgi:hypothetical protein
VRTPGTWSSFWSWASVGTCTAPRSPLARLRGMCPGRRVVGAVLPRRDRASKAVTVPAQDPFPGPGVVGVVLPAPAPLHAVRVQQGDAPSLRSVTLPAWPLPAFRSATVFPRAPHLSRAVLRPRCARARPAPGAPWSAMSNVLDTATRFPSSPLSHKLRSVAGGANVVAEVGSLCASGSGSSHAQPLSVMPTLIPRAMKTPRCSRNLLEAKFRANAPCGTPRGRGVLVSLSPAAVPGGPDTDHASKAVMVCASCPGALAPSMRHLHRAKRWRRLVAGSAATRLPWCRAWRDFFESLTGSPQALSAAAVTALLDAAKRRVDGRAVRRHPLRLRASRSGATGRPGSKSCGRRPHATPPTGGSLPRARKRRKGEQSVSAPRRGLWRNQPCPPTALVQTPAYRPPKGKPAVKSRMPSS